MQIKNNEGWFVHTATLLIISLLVWIVVNIYTIKTDIALIQLSQTEIIRQHNEFRERINLIEKRTIQ